MTINDFSENAGKNSSSKLSSTAPIEKEYTWYWKDLLLIILGVGVFLLIGVIAFIGLSIIRGDDLENLIQPTISQTLGLTALEAVALILGVYLFGMRRRGLTWESVGLRRTSWIWIVVSISVTFLIIPIISLITLAYFFLSGEPMENPQLDFLLPDGLSAIDAVLMLILAGVVAPFAEELLFRGVFYTFLRERWGIWLAVLLSSFLFGLIHGNVAVGITGFLLGIIAALVFEYSKSLWTAVIVHAINNSAKIALLYFLVWLGIEI